MELTEQEITIEAAGANIELYAEFTNGQLAEIYATLDIDGQRMIGYGLGVLIYDGLKFTSFYGSLMLCLSQELISELEREVKKLVKLNGN